MPTGLIPGDHSAITVRDGLLAAIKTLPAHLARSLTWDQGTELTQHRQINMATKMALHEWANDDLFRRNHYWLPNVAGALIIL